MSSTGLNYIGIGLFGFNGEMKTHCYIRIQTAAGANVGIKGEICGLERHFFILMKLQNITAAWHSVREFKRKRITDYNNLLCQ